MTTKEAIAILERLQEPEAWEPQISEDAYTALEMAIEALEKQIPKSPVDTDFDDEMGRCPSCGSLVIWGRTVCYCRRCGQSIDWGMSGGNKTECIEGMGSMSRVIDPHVTDICVGKKTFTVIDNKTGKEADPYEIALHEDWAKHLMYCDMEGFAVEEDGTLILLDECGRHEYCPEGRFEVRWDEG